MGQSWHQFALNKHKERFGAAAGVAQLTRGLTQEAPVQHQKEPHPWGVPSAHL